jgi:hypothetical protein
MTRSKKLETYSTTVSTTVQVNLNLLGAVIITKIVIANPIDKQGLQASLARFIEN